MKLVLRPLLQLQGNIMSRIAPRVAQPRVVIPGSDLCRWCRNYPGSEYYAPNLVVLNLSPVFRISSWILWFLGWSRVSCRTSSNLPESRISSFFPDLKFRLFIHLNVKMRSRSRNLRFMIYNFDSWTVL